MHLQWPAGQTRPLTISLHLEPFCMQLQSDVGRLKSGGQVREPKCDAVMDKILQLSSSASTADRASCQDLQATP